MSMPNIHRHKIVTQNATAFRSVFQGNTDIIIILDGNIETKTTVVPELNSNVTKIKALKNSDGKKAVIWQQESDSGVNFYGVNYNETANSFGAIEPISTDSGIIRGWDACMLPNLISVMMSWIILFQKKREHITS